MPIGKYKKLYYIYHCWKKPTD